MLAAIYIWCMYGVTYRGPNTILINHLFCCSRHHGHLFLIIHLTEVIVLVCSNTFQDAFSAELII